MFRKLAHVDDLAEHLPLDAHTSKLFAERHTTASALDYWSRTSGYVRDLLGKDTVSLVVLTGSAGRGKTHLCQKLVQEAGLSAREALARICLDPAGGTAIELPGASRPVRVIKDLSEFDLEYSAQLLASQLHDHSTITIVAVNEDRLRAIVPCQPDSLGVLLDVFDAGIARGDIANSNDEVYVINLNFHACAPNDDFLGFLRHVLDAWTDDESLWDACTSCEALSRCPIAHNRERLSTNDEYSISWRDNFIQLIRIIEQSGDTMSYREALILVAFTLTGGLRCADVEALVRQRRFEDLDSYFLPRLLFERPLSDHCMAQLPMIMQVRRPGLQHYHHFEHVVRSADDQALTDSILTQVVNGLHAIQGIRPPDQSSAYIGAKQTMRDRLWLTTRYDDWYLKRGGEHPPLADAVDWLEQVVILCDEDGALLELNAAQFECVLRATQGPAPAESYETEREIRRMLVLSEDQILT